MNYEVLRFLSFILTLGEILVVRMKERSVNSDGKYVFVYFCFEEVRLLFLIVLLFEIFYCWVFILDM